eukprot:4860925-Pyramimonas_sp.AAC.1
MPGEDGLPHGAWKVPEAARILYDVYLTLFTDDVTELPVEMGRSLMVFLPKGTDPRGKDDSISRHPSSTRPFSMSNT